MLGAGEYNLCTLRRLKPGSGKCRVNQRKEGAARTDPVAKKKKPFNVGREYATSCEGTVLKREVVNPV